MIHINGVAHITVEEHEQALGDVAREHYHDLSEKDARIGQLIEELIIANRLLRDLIPEFQKRENELYRKLLDRVSENIEGTG